MKFLCSVCGLWVGMEDEPEGPSQPCASCISKQSRPDVTRYADHIKHGAGWKEPFKY